MTREQAISTLAAHIAELRERFDVQSLSVFGSLSRDQMTDRSDADVLVGFAHGATLRGYFALKTRLEELLDRRVDLATDNMLNPGIRRYVDKDLIRVA